MPNADKLAQPHTCAIRLQFPIEHKWIESIGSKTMRWEMLASTSPASAASNFHIDWTLRMFQFASRSSTGCAIQLQLAAVAAAAAAVIIGGEGSQQ